MKKWLFIVLTFATILMLAACNNGIRESTKSTQTSAKSSSNENVKSQDPLTLQLLENEKVGKYLADSKGMTLYYFKKDESKKSNCSGECLKNWPPFTAENFKVPSGFNKSDFGTIARKDTGEKQVTYKGYPLYYFVNDKVKGEVNGQGVKDIWYIVNTETTFH
ncbi:hypothetical protein [Neobacillus ginsengisoli]|uniref:Lipoprotein with Yx(FWY)xxD motif n=1 Tax=Neobacillus ginsengisoli TaxID=904295 RepID=A0ABT9Y2T8_9BACI|nr:hypothetical protein [Neobacillus ginsengisoli]MDQ0202074.1 putative lipoprotein with Yx(FWY)xxD motif [Neobacillus ginsengisoli]